MVALIASIVLLGGTLAVAGLTSAPLPQALQALEPGEGVSVSTEPWLAFSPDRSPGEVGLIFYPGGLIDARAYAPAARAIAMEGYLVVITPMPLNLAFFAPNRAEAVMSAYPQITKWAMAGHSLGGAMAARYTARNPGEIEGLVLWAAYPAASDDLSSTDVSVASVSATADGLVTAADISASRRLLPPDTMWISIEGGNHAQFAFGGEQPGDGSASISREEQQAAALLATLEVLEALRSDL